MAHNINMIAYKIIRDSGKEFTLDSLTYPYKFNVVCEDLLYQLYKYMPTDYLNRVDPQYEIMEALGLEPEKLKPNIVRDKTFLDVDPEYNQDIMGHRLLDIIPKIKCHTLRNKLILLCPQLIGNQHDVFIGRLLGVKFPHTYHTDKFDKHTSISPYII